jgi:hypothetical protein
MMMMTMMMMIMIMIKDDGDKISDTHPRPSHPKQASGRYTAQRLKFE